LFFCFQAEDGIRDLVRSRGLGDVYKRQPVSSGTGISSILEAELIYEVLEDKRCCVILPLSIHDQLENLLIF